MQDCVSVPKFTMAFQNSSSYANISEKVNNSTYRTTYDLNDNSNEILYGLVTVRKTGNGKSVFSYNTLYWLSTGASLPKG